ncbi:O-Glycosyl hydrolase family 30 [Planctomycetes bacterium CA13]|uniref:O-Glycosyl hydrolase family 30 n=1 Tax=Novipirellula herctigrandis TaxID=2527986 RepID=A0A5C5YV13_9BACT|nr:O-Glycosyl hydrolase family 30 [Planctomycetes bacterium CA13]
MNRLHSLFTVILLVLLGTMISDSALAANVRCWLTDPNGAERFEKQHGETRFVAKHPPQRGDSAATILIDPDKSFQSIDGFGFTLTSGSAELLMQMDASARNDLLRELFSTDATGIGVSYLRLSIGASDLSRFVYSYNDLQPGEVDLEMKRFDLGEDRKHVIPILKEILGIAPDISLMGSPWSPPTWMKDNHDSVGGSLLPQYSDAYARYFVAYILAMKSEGICIDAITIQNEPLHPGNNPSLLMLADQQATFIKHHLGPAFEAAGIDTKIIIYDHNCDRPDYPISILNDDEAYNYIDGSAFHLYGGKITAMSQVHEAHPNKNLYFTEQWIGAPGNLAGDMAWHVRELIVGATRNWSRTVLEWNLASDPNQDPHTEGGCDRCLGAITVSGNQVTRNPAYYIVAHASKFVRPGSYRIASNVVPNLPNVAFKTPDGDLVLIVLNDSNRSATFRLEQGNRQATLSLPSRAVATYIWSR